MWYSWMFYTPVLFALGLPVVGQEPDKDRLCYPFQKGTKWTYREADKDVTYILTDVVKLKGKPTVVSVGRVDSDRVTHHKTLEVTNDAVTLTELLAEKLPAPIPLFRRSTKKGETQTIDTVLPGKLPVKWKIVWQGIEDVKVPAANTKRFASSTHIRSRMKMKNQSSIKRASSGTPRKWA